MVMSGRWNTCARFKRSYINESVRLCLSKLSFTEILEEFDACDALWP